MSDTPSEDQVPEAPIPEEVAAMLEPDKHALKALADLGIDPSTVMSGDDVDAFGGENGSFAEKAKKPEKKEAPPNVIGDDEEFGDCASVIDQFERYGDHCRTAPPETMVFNLSIPTQLKAWNAVQAKMIQPGTKAGNLLIQHSIDFYSGVYYVVASVRKVTFSRLV